MINSSSDESLASGRPGPARVTRTSSPANPRFWPAGGPLSPEVRQHLAEGFGARVRALRVERGVSQVKLGELLCCDERTIRRLEHGEHRPTRQQVAWIASALSTREQPAQVLDWELLDLIGEHMRPRMRRHRRRGIRTGLYTLPVELTAEFRALEKQLRRVISSR